MSKVNETGWQERMYPATTIYDSHSDDYQDPRIEKICALVRELAAERAEAGLVCLKAGDERAEEFFVDATNAERHLTELLEDLGY